MPSISAAEVACRTSRLPLKKGSSEAVEEGGVICDGVLGLLGFLAGRDGLLGIEEGRGSGSPRRRKTSQTRS